MYLKNTLISLFILIYSTSIWAQTNKEFNIAFLRDSQIPEVNDFTDKLRLEIESLLGNSYQINFQTIEEEILIKTPSQVKDLIQKVNEDESIDMVIGIGWVISGALAEEAPHNKPVISTSVLDTELQEIPYSDEGTSGVKNFTYVVSPTEFNRDIEVFYEIYPFKRLTIFLGSYFYERIQGNQNEQFENFMKAHDVQSQVISIKDDIEQAISEIDTLSDAVYFGPLIGVNSQDGIRLIHAVNEKRLPSFAFFGRPAVARGVLAGLAPEGQLNRVARRVALNIEKYLDNGKLADMSVEMSYQEALTINMATAREIGFSPGWDFLREATLLNEVKEDVPRTLSLFTAIDEALVTNWTLAIANKTVEAGAREVQESRSGLLPQLDISASSRLIDQDRAAAGQGLLPERLTTGSAAFNQVIFSEGASANFRVAKLVQESTVENRDAVRLDVILETAEAYLNVLIAKTVESIQKENISLTKINLQLAGVRQEVGYSGPSDLYRWQSNLALANIDLNNVQAERLNAEINLNRILNRPLDENFVTEETDISDPNLITNDSRIDSYVGNPEALKRFTAFMVSEGLNNLPELRELDATIAAQERLTKFYRRNFYLPEVGINAGTDYFLNRAGAGSMESPGNVNDLTWNLGVSATIPIFVGGKRTAIYQRGLIELESLSYQRNDLVNQLEQRIRSAMAFVGASYSNIGLSLEAERNALLNFDLIQEEYQQGRVSVINLIDAQNEAVQARLNAANAGYQFIIDILRVDRSIGIYYSLVTDEDRETFFMRLESFVDNYQN